MGINYNPKAVTDGLLLCLDAANIKSYPSTGTVWTNLMGTGINGTLTNGPTFSSSNGGSIVFDGSNDFISVADVPFRISNADLTVEVVFYYGGGSVGYNLVSKRRGGPTYEQYNLAVYNGNPYTGGNGNVLTGFFRKDGGDTPNDRTLTYTLPSAGIYHVVMTSSTASANLYANGILRSTSTVSLGSSPTYNIVNQLFVIGQTGSSSSFFSGNIYTVRFYNRTLNATEVQQNFNTLRGRFGL